MDLRERVESALSALGSCPAVPFTVTEVEVSPVEIQIQLTLAYARATPVCCSEPGCYVPFLGLKSHEVPLALSMALELPALERVEMTVSLVHEPGYRHVNVTTGEILMDWSGDARDCVIEYGPATFKGPHH